MLFRTKLKYQFIDIDELNFSLEGLMSPTFYNDGETSVLINYQEVLPGETFSIEVPNGVFEGNCRIQFKSEAGKVNRLVLNSATYLGKYLNEENGLPWNNQEGELC
jgi:hypothetical protein